MKERIFSPDIECESCAKVIGKAFKQLQGIESFVIKGNSIDVEYDESLIHRKNIVQAIKDKGYRASLEPYTKKRIGERAKEFMTDKKKYAIEYVMLRNIFFSAILFFLLTFAAVQGEIIEKKYLLWMIYLTLSIVFLAGAIWHLKAYRTQFTSMIGMMIGMTLGMQTGLLIGAVIGATNGFFIGALVGMLLGAGVGAYCGSCCGIMGIMEGMMAGVMGGTMGAMITFMMFNDHLVLFMPFYVTINILILIGLSYMLFEEVVEDRGEVLAKPHSFVKFISGCLLAWIVLTVLMMYAPPSIFLV